MDKDKNESPEPPAVASIQQGGGSTADTQERSHIGGKTLNIITSGQQTLNGVKMKGQKAMKTGKTQKKIEATYLLFLT